MGSTERSKKWEPGRTHWIATTAIAVIGAVVGGTSLFMNFFYHPAPDPVTISSKHSDFTDLSYSDRLDLCVPYISKNIEGWMSNWQKGISEIGGLYQAQPLATPAVGTADATGQQIVNEYIAVSNYAKKRAEANEGKNLQSCLLTPQVSNGWKVIEPRIEETTAIGNSIPRADMVVLNQSPNYMQGAFGGISADGLTSRVIEIIEWPGTQYERRLQLGFSLVSGHDKNTVMWANATALAVDNPQWVKDLPSFGGYADR